MRTDYITSLSLLKAKAGDSFEIGRIQDHELKNSLAGMRSLLDMQSREIKALNLKFERRTAVFSPTKAFSSATYSSSLHTLQGNSRVPSTLSIQSSGTVGVSLFPITLSQQSTYSPPLTPRPITGDVLGFYLADNNSPRAYVN